MAVSEASGRGAVRDFLGHAGPGLWQARLEELQSLTGRRSLAARAARQRHAVELALAKLCEEVASEEAGPTDRAILDLACRAVRLADSLPAPARERLHARLAAALSGQANLIPLFHLVRVAEMHRARGFEVRFDGLAEDAPYDLLITRDGVSAEIACETVSAEDGRQVHRSGWCALVDRINPDLHTWLSAHPGRYVLKMTLPEGMREPAEIAGLHRRISALLSEQRRQDTDAAAILKLDPLLTAGAALAGQGLPASLRAQFGPEAHLAMAGDPGGGSVIVLAARAGREDDVAAAVCRRLAVAARGRLTGTRPGILAVFLDDLERAEWQGLRRTLALEGAVRRFLTGPDARRVVAVSCASRMEMLTADGVEEGELRFRNPSHPEARSAALMPAVTSAA